MSLYRYFRLDGADGGEWPTDHALKVGAIVRVDLTGPQRSALTTDAWNEQTKDWVHARWVEVPDPALNWHVCSICGDIHDESVEVVGASMDSGRES